MIGFILNLPFTIIGIIVALVSFPIKVSAHAEPFAFIFEVKSLWWTGIGYMKGARAAAIGHVVILGPHIESKDLEHELIHVEQHQRRPLVQPLLYYIEQVRKGGGMNNKYEREAYEKAGNTYKEEFSK